MRAGNMSGFVLQDVRVRTLQHPWQTTTETRRLIAKLVTASTGFYPNQLNFLVDDELVKYSNSIRSTTHAGDYRCRQLAFSLHNLLASLLPDHAMKIANHGRIRMRSQHASQQIVRCADVGDPVAHGFVDRIFQR